MVRLKAEKDIETLRQAALILERENQVLARSNVALLKENCELKGMTPEQLQQRIQFLEEQLAKQRQQLFGDSSERRPHSTKAERKKEARRGHGPTPQPALPQVEEVHELDEADRICPQCGGQLEEWEGQYEESEEVDVLERRFVIRKHKRKKYRCRCNACVETVPGPEKLFPGARYSLDFAVEVATGKYADHLPLERQVRIMEREGLLVTSQTLWDQLDALARLLGPAHDRLHEHVLAQSVIGADETHWKMLHDATTGGGKKEAKKGKRWQVWCVASAEAVCYRIADSRSTEAAGHLLQDYGGRVLTDGYAAYESLKKKGAKFELSHCWAHVRRKYVEAEEFFPDESREMLDLIGGLYVAERDCPHGLQGDEQRRKIREEQSREIVSRIHAWLLEHRRRALPKSSLGSAIAYTLNLWPGLTRFLDDPSVPLDNNGVERALRSVVLGRKNHYGSRSRRGTEVAALYYSLVESAKLVHVEPKSYLREAAHAALRDQPIPLPHETK